MSRPKQPERRELWRQRIAQQQASGQSVRDFCRKHGFSEQPFYTWRKTLGTTPGKPVSFALVETSKQKPVAPIELLLNGGHTLRIPADTTTLRLVFDALQQHNKPA